ncbi:MAG: O-antigen ligase family protein [Erysipelotrichaceae bacterium]
MKDKMRSYSVDEKIIIGVGASIFMPYYITAIAIIGALGYVTYTKRWMLIINRVPRSKFMLAFCALITAVSLFYANWLGVACSIGITLIVLFVFYYRVYVTKSAFEMFIDVAILLSVLCCIYALFEYVYRITVQLGWDLGSLKIPSKRQYRIRVGFFNSNYFAMIVEFGILLCIYRLRKLKDLKKMAFYLGAILLHFVILYLSGCRTAWPAVVAGIGIMLILNKNKIFIALFGVGVVGAGGLLILKPTLIPRLTFLQRNIAVRMKIWNAAIIGIKEHFLLGQGPLTYFLKWKEYKGHNTQHAHSVYLDPLMSFGIVGVAIAAVYIGSNLKEVWNLYRKHLDQPLAALVAGFIVVILVHGFLDYTIFWIQTGLLFFMVLSASSIYRKETHLEK